MSEVRTTTFAEEEGVYQPGHRNGQLWHTVGIKEDVIWDTRSTLQVGEKNGKTWSRFRHEGSTFYSKKTGRLRILEKTVLPANVNRAKRAITYRDQTAFLMEHGSPPLHNPAMMSYLAEWYPKIDPFSEVQTPQDRWAFLATNKNAVQERIRSTIRNAEYPLAEIFQVRNGLTSSLTGTMQDLAIKQFKPSRYRKDLVKALGGLQTERREHATTKLAIAVAAAPLIPMDWIIAFLQRELIKPKSSEYRLGFGYDEDFNIRAYRLMFRGMTEKQLRRAFRISTIKNNQLYYVGDAAKAAVEIMDQGYSLAQYEFQTWEQWHDLLATEQRKLKHKNRSIVYNGLYESVTGGVTVNRVPPLANEELAIVAASGTHQVVEWGAQMNHCIGTYANQAADGTTWLYGVYKGKELLANMQIDRKGRVSQLYGKHNARMEPARDTAIRQHVAEHFGTTTDGLLLNDGRPVRHPRANGGIIHGGQLRDQLRREDAQWRWDPPALADWERELLEGF